MLTAQSIGLGGARLEFALDREADLQGHGRHQHDQKGADRWIDHLAGNRLADLASAVDHGLLAKVDWDGPTLFLTVADAHLLTAQAAKHAALEQGGPFSNRPRPTFEAEVSSVVGESNLIGLEAFPVDVSAVLVGDHELPVGHRQLDLGDTAVRSMARACSAIEEGAGISRIVQDLSNAGMARRRPKQLALVWFFAETPRKQDALVEEESDRSYRASGALERIEDQPKRPLHLYVGVEVEASIGAVGQTHRRADLKHAAPSLLSWPPRMRALRICSSASLIVPFKPNNNLSLKQAGS